MKIILLTYDVMVVGYYFRNKFTFSQNDMTDPLFVQASGRSYQGVLDDLEELAREHNLQFQKGETIEREGGRTYFQVIGKNKAKLGFVTMPKLPRKYDGRAFNAIYPDDHPSLREYEGKEDEGRRIACLVLQCWGDPYPLAEIPLRELERTPVFRNDGYFNVKEENGRFYLITPTGESNTLLRRILDKEDLSKILDDLKDKG